MLEGRVLEDLSGDGVVIGLKTMGIAGIIERCCDAVML